MSLKPQKCFVEFHYQCPECGTIHFVSELQAKYSGFVFECCQQLHSITAISSIDIDIKFAGGGGMKPKPDVQSKQEASLPRKRKRRYGKRYNHQKSIEILVKQGFNKRDAIQMVEGVADGNVADIVKTALESVEIP